MGDCNFGIWGNLDFTSGHLFLKMLHSKYHDGGSYHANDCICCAPNATRNGTIILIDDLSSPTHTHCLGERYALAEWT